MVVEKSIDATGNLSKINANILKINYLSKNNALIISAEISLLRFRALID